MKESNIPVGNASKSLDQMQLLLNTKGQYMKESNFLAFYVANNFLTKDILLNTK